MNPRKSHPKGREIVEESNLLRRKHMLWNVSTQERGGSLRVRRRNKQYSPRPCKVNNKRQTQPYQQHRGTMRGTMRTPRRQRPAIALLLLAAAAGAGSMAAAADTSAVTSTLSLKKKLVRRLMPDATRCAPPDCRSGQLTRAYPRLPGTRTPPARRSHEADHRQLCRVHVRGQQL